MDSKAKIWTFLFLILAEEEGERNRQKVKFIERLIRSSLHAKFLPFIISFEESFIICLWEQGAEPQRD